MFCAPLVFSWREAAAFLTQGGAGLCKPSDRIDRMRIVCSRDCPAHALAAVLSLITYGSLYRLIRCRTPDTSHRRLT